MEVVKKAGVRCPGLPLTTVVRHPLVGSFSVVRRVLVYMIFVVGWLAEDVEIAVEVDIDLAAVGYARIALPPVAAHAVIVVEKSEPGHAMQRLDRKRRPTSLTV